ncbi:MAG: DUF1572 domain-containing protein [Acidobacteriota bacterium]|nr:DUF1572 domain-containing protein [Acidobacteriota bacterium]
MTTPRESNEKTVSVAFIQESRRLLKEEYLPKIERCLERLTDQQIWSRSSPESNSIGNLILHLSGNARQWIVCGLGGETDTRARDSEFKERSVIPREELLSRLRKTVADVDRVLAGFDSSLLLNKYRIQGTESTALDAILHVTEHFSMHAGQVILITKVLTRRDLHFYDL